MIDDDLDEAELFFDALQSINSSINFKSFTGGGEAIRYLRSEEQMPDCIFLDLNMPLLSGKDLLKMLREEQRTKQIPVVIYSTTISPNDIQDTEVFNVYRFLRKPEDFPRLCKSLKEVLMGLK